MAKKSKADNIDEEYVAAIDDFEPEEDLSLDELEIVDIRDFEHAQEVLGRGNEAVFVEDNGVKYRYWIRQPLQKDVKAFMKRLPKNRVYKKTTFISNDVDMAFLPSVCVMDGPTSDQLLFRGKDALKQWEEMPPLHVSTLFKAISKKAGLGESEEEKEGNEPDF